jgi:hypothetical protein
VNGSSSGGKDEVDASNDKYSKNRFPFPFKIRYGSKQGPTELSDRIENEFLQQALEKNMRYNDFCQYWIERQYTPLFEWCSLKNHIGKNTFEKTFF